MTDAAGTPSANTDTAGEEHTGVGVFLIPAESDPIVAASSEQAHMTTIWMGSKDDLTVDLDEIEQAVRLYAQDLDGPVVVPVVERGTLGDESADVVFLEATEALLALRDGMLANEPIKTAHDSVEQYPEWTPHVTLGYPETPALGEYDGDAVTFDRVGLWVGPEQYTYPMGEAVSKGLAAGGNIQGDRKIVGDGIDGSPDYVVPLNALKAAGISVERWERALRAAGTLEKQILEGEVDDEDDEMPADELEEGEELITEIPVHGVAVVEGRPTGDGRGFKLDALSIGKMPQPLGYEYVSGHGANTSMVAIVGRVDEYWREEVDGVAELRWRGVIMPGKEYGARAIESIVDGSYTGLSIIVDSVTVDVTEDRDQARAMLMRERDAGLAAATDEPDATEAKMPLSDEEIEAMVDDWVGDGTQPVTWYSAAQVRRFDMVPTGAFQEAYVALGHEFADELTEEQLTASAAALADCGCRTRLVASGGLLDDIASWVTVDLTGLTEEEIAAYDLMSIEEQAQFARERGLLAAAGFAPGTKDGPGWITHPVATNRIRRYWTKGKGAAKIGWGTPGDFNRCRAQLAKYVQNPDWLAGLCSNMHKEVLGVWPGQEGGGRGHSLTASAVDRSTIPMVTIAEQAPSALTAAGGIVYPASAFAEPTDDRPFAMRIDKAARTITGYAAAWDSCHIGIAGTCETAPYSNTDYAYFRKGVVDTDEGEQRVGLITSGIGHAGQFASPAAATAHYDQTDAVRCYINIGENAHGIWYAGVFAPGVTEAQMDEMRAIGRVSGDWRSWSGRAGDLEMVGLVCVNTEGFQLAASAAIGIGALSKDEGSETAAAEQTIVLSRDDVVGIALATAEQVVALQQRQEIIERVAPARAVVEARLLATARSALSKRIGD